jgi:hypothetical protein
MLPFGDSIGRSNHTLIAADLAGVRREEYPLLEAAGGRLVWSTSTASSSESEVNGSSLINKV